MDQLLATGYYCSLTLAVLFLSYVFDSRQKSPTMSVWLPAELSCIQSFGLSLHFPSASLSPVGVHSFPVSSALPNSSNLFIYAENSSIYYKGVRRQPRRLPGWLTCTERTKARRLEEERQEEVENRSLLVSEDRTDIEMQGDAANGISYRVETDGGSCSRRRSQLWNPVGVAILFRGIRGSGVVASQMIASTIHTRGGVLGLDRWTTVRRRTWSALDLGDIYRSRFLHALSYRPITIHLVRITVWPANSQWSRLLELRVRSERTSD